MPSKTPKQHRTMAKAAKDKSFAKEKGIPQSVAKEYVQKGKGKKVAKGGKRGKK